MSAQRFRAQIRLYLGLFIVPGVLVAQGARVAAQGVSFSSNVAVEQPLDSATGGSSAALSGFSMSVPAAAGTLKPSLKTAARLHATLDDLAKMLDQFRQNGNRHEEANVLCATANAYRDLHEQQRSLESFHSALVLWRAIGDKRRQAETLSQIGDVYREWGFPDRAVPFYRQSLAIFSATNDAAAEAEAMNGLGVAYLSLRDKKRSLDYFNRALVAYEARHDRLGEARAMSNLGATYFSLVHDPMKAITTLQEALTRLEVLNDTANEANALEIMGMAWKSLGKPEVASIELRRALMIFHQIGSAEGENSIRRQLELLKGPSS
jgi:tetratricopeptide (TPR) repeat protein